MQHQTKIIAEIGANHMGNMKIAESMIRLAAAIGIDIVKFQSWRAQSLQKNFPDYESVFKRHISSQLSDEDHYKLIALCRELKVQFLTTCFDLSRVDFLSSLNLESIKVASPDSHSFKLIDKLLKEFPHVIISTGMTTDKELQQLMERVRGCNVTLMHCVSLYPCPLDQINLERMRMMKDHGFDVGFSDHSLGIEAGQLAIAWGASYLEKHFTLSRFLPGKDQSISTEYYDFEKLVKWASLVTAMSGVKNPSLSQDESKLRDIYIGKWGVNT